MGPLESTLSVGEVLATLGRQRVKMAAFFVVVMALVVIGTALAEARYESVSKLFVRLGRENVALDPTATMGEGLAMAVPGNRETEINSVVEMLNSRVFAERLVDAFGATALLGSPRGEGERLASNPGPRAGSPAAGASSGTGPPSRQERDRARAVWNARRAPTRLAPDRGIRVAGLPAARGGAVASEGSWLGRLNLFGTVSARERAVTKVRRRLGVSAAEKSNVITVVYEARTPELAQAVVSKLVELFLEDHVRMNRTEGSREFFERETALIKARLLDAERELRDVKDATGVASISDQRRILVERIGGLEDQELATEAALAVAVSEVEAAVARLRNVPEMLVTERSTGLANEAADGMRQTLYELELREQELLSKYTEAMPAVQEVQRQIREARQILASEEADRTQVTSGRNPAFEALHLAMLTAQSEVASQRARFASVRRQLGGARGGLQALNDNEMRLSQLQRELDLREQSYRSYATNLERVRVDRALQADRISNISVVQPATLEERPTRPKTLLNLVLGLMFASVGSLGLAFVADYAERYRRS